MDNASRDVADQHGRCNRARHSAGRVVAHAGALSWPPRPCSVRHRAAPPERNPTRLAKPGQVPMPRSRCPGPEAQVPKQRRPVMSVGLDWPPSGTPRRSSNTNGTSARWYGGAGDTMERGLRLGLGRRVWIAEATNRAAKIPDAMACNVRTARAGHWWSHTSPRRPVSAHLAEAVEAEATSSDALPYNVRMARAGRGRSGLLPPQPVGTNPPKPLEAKAKIPDALPYNVRPIPNAQRGRGGIAPPRPWPTPRHPL
jgi:hypothetical protein